MASKILLDTNIVLDLILEREPFIEDTLKLFQKIENRQLEGFITATTITNLFYILRKARGRSTAIAAIQQLLALLQLCPVDRHTIETALTLDLKDFEDSVQLAGATLAELDAIVTRDRQDFANSPIPVLSPAELLDRLT